MSARLAGTDFSQAHRMKRALLPSGPFIRAARRLARKNPGLAEDVQVVLSLLAEDPWHPSLRTHKLKGPLAGSWSCSVAYDLRIVFRLVASESGEAILLEGVGNHDEVY